MIRQGEGWWLMPKYKTTAEVMKIIGNKNQIRKA